MSRSRLSRALAGSALLVFVSACSSWERRPPDPEKLLRELEAMTLTDLAREGLAGREVSASDGNEELEIEHAVRFAVTYHPELRVRRAAIGVHEALIVEAGVLPDISVGWSAMDALATKWTGGTPTTRDYLSGLGMMWQLPRPGEWPAREGVAKADRDAAHASIVHAEWMLAGAVRSAFVEHAAARAQLALSRSFQVTVQRSADWFERASEAGTATPLQAELVGLELSKFRQDRLQREGDVRRTHQRLCALMGLPPEQSEFGAGVSLDAIEAGLGEPLSESADPTDLVRASLERRPDLQELVAQYETAEQAIRLEVAKQWPGVSIGTGIQVMVGLFRGFENPAIETARARRALLGEQLRVAVHYVRAEVHETWHAALQARRELTALEQQLLPGIERSVELSGRAFSSRAVDFAEILEAQRQILEARRWQLTARAQLALRRVQLRSALGQSSRPSAKSVPGGEAR